MTPSQENMERARELCKHIFDWGNSTSGYEGPTRIEYYRRERDKAIAQLNKALQEAEERGRVEERLACAELAEELETELSPSYCLDRCPKQITHAIRIAQAIRQRSSK